MCFYSIPFSNRFIATPVCIIFPLIAIGCIVKFNQDFPFFRDFFFQGISLDHGDCFQNLTPHVLNFNVSGPVLFVPVCQNLEMEMIGGESFALRLFVLRRLSRCCPVYHPV